MAEDGSEKQEFTFKNVQLFKNETLGTGSYGAVCKAKCDQLMCAAKLLYPVLFQIQAPDPGKEHRQPFRRFETECRFLSLIHHPNIVLYLGTYRDTETNAPVLLMELMDESLTHYLESSAEDIPYHIQVNLATDVAQALAFLHTNGIIHRDLSSNNVLLIAGSRAKITDFGMSRFVDLNQTRLHTMTTCPGTPAFMSPEALDEPPVYTEKLDNFSFGVLLVQIVTRKFPKPADRLRTKQMIDPSVPNQMIGVKVPVPEAERRQAHISLVEPTHPFLPIALDCLKDKDSERPSSQQLCQLLDAQKHLDKYEQSLQAKEELEREKDRLIQVKEGIIRANQESLQAKQVENDQLRGSLQTEQVKNSQLRERLHEKQEENVQLMEGLQLRQEDNNRLRERVQYLNREKVTLEMDKQDLQRENEVKEIELQQFRQQTKNRKETAHATEQTSIEECVADKNGAKPMKHTELEESVTVLSLQNARRRRQGHSQRRGAINIRSKRQQALRSRVSIRVKQHVKLVWENLPNTSNNLFAGSSTVIGNYAYFSSGAPTIHEFNSSTSQWSILPDHPLEDFCIVNIGDTLTTAGGIHTNWLGSSKYSKTVYSYSNRKWVESFPPMMTGRSSPAAVCANNTLIVLGGFNVPSGSLTTIEIMNITERQWFSVGNLPFSTSTPSVSVFEDQIYLHGGFTPSEREKYSVVRCSVVELEQPNVTDPTWIKIDHLAVSRSSLTSVKGHLLAIGGENTEGEPTTDIYQYDPTRNIWQVVSQLLIARSKCLTAVFPEANKLLVVGDDSEQEIEIELGSYN